MTLGGAAQVAAAHCPNERTLDPTVCSYKASYTLGDYRSVELIGIWRMLQKNLSSATVRLLFAGDIWHYMCFD